MPIDTLTRARVRRGLAALTIALALGNSNTWLTATLAAQGPTPPQAGAPGPEGTGPRDFIWTDPRTGTVYSLPEAFSDVWPKLPDSVRSEVARADAGARAAYAADLRLAVDAHEQAMAQRLGELGREPTPRERALIAYEAAQAAHETVLRQPPSADRSRLAEALALEAAGRAAVARRAVIDEALAKQLPKVQVFASERDRTTTLDALKRATLAQVAPLQRMNRENGTTVLVQDQFIVVVDPATGNFGFLPETGGAGSVTVEDVIRAIGSTREKVIVGHVTFEEMPGKPAEWAIDLSRFPEGFGRRDISFWRQLFASLINDDQGEALNGFLLKIQGSKAFIDGDDRWWVYNADAEILTPTRPTVTAETATDIPFFTPSTDAPQASAVQPAGPLPPAVQEPTPLPDPASAPTPTDTLQGPVDPETEARIRALLDNTWTPEQLDAKLRAREFDVFRDELFRGATPDERAARLRAWKKVLAESAYSRHSDLLSRLRFEMVVTICEQIALHHKVKMELIDSGKTNGFRSDIDLTLYIPFESRGGISAAGAIQLLTTALGAMTGTTPAAIDVTIHNGDYFVPDPRNTTQSFEDYARTLHEVLRQLRENVAAGLDAYTDPDANRRQVQRRGLRGRVISLTPVAEPGGTVLVDGRPMPLATRLTVRREEQPISALSWRPGGGWDINSERFGGLGPTVGPVRPNFDPSDKFGNMRQSLTGLIERGNDPEVGAKMFGRGVNEGIGGSAVNSYYDLHVSDLDDPTPGLARAPGDNTRVIEGSADHEILLAFDIEEMLSGRLTDAQFTEKAERLLGIVPPDADMSTSAFITSWHAAYRRAIGTKNFEKLRWIVRHFGIPRPTRAWDFEDFRKLKRLLDVSAEMERLKNLNQFNFKDGAPGRGRSSWLQPYFEEARKIVDTQGEFTAGQVNMDAYLDAVYAEALRMHTAEQKRVLVEGMAREMVRMLRDLTPAGMARNAMQFAGPDGKPDIQAARKLAQQRREQLVQVIELFESLEPDQNTRLSPAEAESLRRALIEKVYEQAPESIKAQIEALMMVEDASFDNFLNSLRPEDGQVLAELEAKRVRIKEFIEAKRKRLNALGKTVEPVTPQEIREHWFRRLLNEFQPSKADYARPAWDKLDQLAKADPTFAPEVQANFASGLVLANSLVNVARALQSGDDRLLREVMVGEFFNLYLPPRYGVVAMLLKDFGRGEWFSGGMSVVTLGLQTGLFHLVPGLGEAYLIFDIARNGALIAYTYFSEEIANDLVEQALRSRPKLNGSDSNVLNLPPGDANPYRQAGKGALNVSARISATTPPRFPLLFEYSECGDPAAVGLNWGQAVTLKTPFDRISAEALIPQARKNHAATIWKFLVDNKMTPRDVDAATYLGVPFLGIRQLAQTNADFERDRLEHMFAFDLPYAYRVRQIWECFSPTLKKRQAEALNNPIAGPGATDENALLDQIFGEVVDKWLSLQQDGYADQYASLVNIGGGGGPESRFGVFSPLNASTQSRVRRILVAALVERYRWYERIGPASTVEVEAMQREAAAMSKQLDSEERRAAGMKKTIVNELGQRLDEHVTSLAGQDRKEVSPTAWLQAPPYYIPLKPAATLTQGATPVSGSQVGRLIGAPGLDRSDIVANVRADRARHPEPWSAQYNVAIQSCDPNWQAALPGLRFSADERQLVERIGPDGRPTHRVVAVNFAAGADILDARGQTFVSTRTIPLRGYVIDPIPQARRTVTVRVDTRVNGLVVREVTARVRVGNQEKSTVASTSEPGIGIATFTGFEPGSYDIQVTPEGPSFGTGSASASFTAPAATPQACAVPDERPQDLTVNVTLAYTPTPTTTTSTASGGVTPPQGNAGPSTPGPGTTTSGAQRPDPALVASCASMVQRARDLLAAGNPGLAANWLGQAQQQCAGAGAEVAAGIGEQLGGLEGALQGAIDRCNLTDAFSIAQQARAAFAGDPRLTGWLDSNLETLSTQAEAQRRAQEFLLVSEDAIRRGDLRAAIAALNTALSVPNLPPCLANPIRSLLGDLTRRQTFGNLVGELVTATDTCDVDAAVGIMGRLKAIQPRDETMNAWFALNKEADVEALKKAFESAQELKADALAVWRTATTAAEWARVIELLEQARSTAFACANTLGIDGLIATARGRGSIPDPTPPTPPGRPPSPPPTRPTPPPTPPTPPPVSGPVVCRIVAAPDLGYQGDQISVTIEIDSRVASQVSRVVTSNPGCPSCATDKAGPVRYTQTLFLTGQPEISLVSRAPAPLGAGGGSFTSSLPGFEKRVPISFVASDAQNRNVCSASTDVKFGGTRP